MTSCLLGRVSACRRGLATLVLARCSFHLSIFIGRNFFASSGCGVLLFGGAGKQLKRLGLFGCNVERQKVEAALILAGATNARLSLHNVREPPLKVSF